jgi:hypothetical protein
LLNHATQHEKQNIYILFISKFFMINKRIGVVFVFSLVLLLSVSFVSAGWFGDLWGKITGKAIVDSSSCDDCVGKGYYWCEGGVSHGTCDDDDAYLEWLCERQGGRVIFTVFPN